mgnify:CR=1 FL=1
MKPSDFFTPAQKTAMVAAIRQAEKDTSGEIRIHFENHCRKNVLDRAAQVFADLKMHKTALRNGVLIYVALEDKQLAILGDAGINAKVPDHFWDDIKNNMIEKFKSGQICEGVCEAVLTAGQQLKVFFPIRQTMSTNCRTISHLKIKHETISPYFLYMHYFLFTGSGSTRTDAPQTDSQ